MPPERQHNTPRLAIRRHTDRCFHEVEEVVPERLAVDGAERGGRGDIRGNIRGYIIDGVMIDADDVAEVREIPDDGAGPECIDEPANS